MELHNKDYSIGTLNIGIADLESNNIKIYPSPTTDNLTIEMPQSSRIEVMNVEGQIISLIESADKKTTINLSNLSSGIYIIKALTENGIVTKKFLKQ
jgi:hypothetical protein